MSREPIGARGGGYGLDAEVARKLASKYDPEVEAAVCSWISQIIGEPVEGSLLVALKNGQQLCKLINVVRPGSVRKIETSAIPFKQMENISNFLKACRVVGVPEHDLFETVDLYEGKVCVYYFYFLEGIYSCLSVLSYLFNIMNSFRT